MPLRDPPSNGTDPLMTSTKPSLSAEPTGWHTLGLLNRYHWFVFIVAALGWLADCMDQQLFVLVRQPAIASLLNKSISDPDVGFWRDVSTSIFLIGWATGGITFGILGDRWGRVKTMLVTILLYSLFTGLSAFSVGVYDFAFYRFLTGLGVGGEFAVGVALVAEVMPDRARPYTLGLLQSLSAAGNVTAALLVETAGNLDRAGFFNDFLGMGPVAPWRVLFVVGILPALIALVVRGRLREPERWQQLAATGGEARKAGSYAELLGQKPWKRHAIAGLVLASAGVIGLWAIGFYTPDLQEQVFTRDLAARGLEGDALRGEVTKYKGRTSLMLQFGAFCGMFAFSTLTSFLGRRLSFALFLFAATGSTALVFLQFRSITDIYWMVPLMGFCQLALFGGYAIYFPELFPTRLRSTGTSFCYNVGRFIAAMGPILLLQFRQLFAHHAETDSTLPFRYAGLTMCSVFAVGLVALLFLPETKGKPLPE
jgi:MFS family permease